MKHKIDMSKSWGFKGHLAKSVCGRIFNYQKRHRGVCPKCYPNGF